MHEPPQAPSADATSSTAAGDGRHQLLKLLLELGPIAVFFIANARADIFVGTAAFMTATVASLVASKALFGRLPVMPLVSGVFVIVFGALTLWLQSEIFIKIKPTIVNVLFGTILLGGLAFGILVLKHVLEYAFELSEAGWRKLTIRWALFFYALAVLNEIVWRTFSTEAWITFKLWGIMPLTVLFGLAQLSLIKSHLVEPRSSSREPT